MRIKGNFASMPESEWEVGKGGILTLCYPTRIANHGEIHIEHLSLCCMGNNEYGSCNASLQRSSILRNAGMSYTHRRN